ncbi:hypothetical protein Dimus_035960 [Dionaea muscipula]
MSRRGLPLKARVLGVGLKEGVEEVGGRSGKDAKTLAEEVGLEGDMREDVSDGQRFGLEGDLIASSGTFVKALEKRHEIL